jgi:hypothetical protein
MQSTVLPLAFVGALGVFALWLVVMLRHERTHRVAIAPATPITSVSASVTRPGSFCRVPGNIGHTKKGVVLVCEASPTGRPRWRRAEVFKIAS